MRFEKGQTPWNKGIKMWENRNHPRGTLGKIPWNKGLKGKQKHTVEWKRKASELAKLNENIKLTQFKKGHSTWNKNKKTPEEVKEKQSKSKIEFYKNNPEAILFWYEHTRKNLIIPTKDTAIEIRVQNFLKQLNIEFYTHQYVKTRMHEYQCDILIPIQKGIKKKTIIECDGDWWHVNPKRFSCIKEWQIERVKRDSIKTKELLKKRWRVIRLWESEINKMELKDLEKEIK
jgi:G:T-mismatch repair DNA endonuclease (very short patch repair protein)